MNEKKMILIILLILIVFGSIALLVNAKPKENKQIANTAIQARNTTNDVVDEANDVPETTNETKDTTETTDKNDVKEKAKTTITKLTDGTLYEIEKKTPNKIIGDNYFDTQITDMMMNYSSYKNKVIEIEGMYMESYYTYVGRYSTSNLCPTCPTGYSYLEYTWDGEPIELKHEESWIKVIGTLQVGNDASSEYQDYYYLKASSIEVMNKRGKDTVNN